jgi:hypothetical protein
MSETITDPEVAEAGSYGPPLGWYDADKDIFGNQYGEIGDICNQNYALQDADGRDVTLLNGDGYYIQQEFSNAISDCAMGQAELGVSAAKRSILPSSQVSFTVTAYDDSGAVDPTYTGTAHIASSDAAATLPADHTFTTGSGADNGVHTFSATLNTVGNQTLTATDTTTATQTGSVSVQVDLAAPTNLSAGWHMLGGDGLLVSQSGSAWSYVASTGQWVPLTAASPQQPLGAGAWQNLASTASYTVYEVACGSGLQVNLVAHRWNMVGNPCSKSTNLPAGTRAFTWTGATYAPTTSIAAGAAAWVMPGQSSVNLGNGS